MTDETPAAPAAPVTQPTAPIPDNTPAIKPDATPAPAAPDDFDENTIPETSRESFRKYRESQKAKYSDLEKQANESRQKLNEETRRRMEFEAKYAEYEAKQKAASGQPADPGEMPDYKAFPTIEEYRDALLKWAKQAGVNDYRQQLARQQQEQTEAERQQKLQAKGNQARAKYPDFNQIVAPILPMANQIPVLTQFINEFDTGTDVLYHLGKNPAVLEGLKQMQPFAAGQELLRIQAALSTPAPKAVTQAPEPMKPVDTGNDSSVKGILELVKKDDISDFIARENRKALRKKGAE